jgi:hypothetical protein
MVGQEISLRKPFKLPGTFCIIMLRDSLTRINLLKESAMLRSYEAFLLNKKAMKPQYVSFYMKWVSDCYGFLNEPLSTRLSQDQKKQFLSQMSKHYEEWQVKQADTALRLYDYLLSRDKETAAAAPAEWKALEGKMREALRLRQRSLSTEKTYLTWVRSFRDWTGEKPPAGLQGRDLQDFLSHLAVEKKISPSTQNQALNGLVFFYRHVLDKEIDNELSALWRFASFAIYGLP